MKRAKIIISLQVLFLATTVIFSTGIAYNSAQQDMPAAITTNLAIQQKGYQLISPDEYQKYQEKLSDMDSTLRAFEAVSQGIIPNDAEEISGIPGAYLVPLVTSFDDPKKQAVLVILSRTPIEGLDKYDTLSGLVQTYKLNAYLPPIKSINEIKSSSAGTDIKDLYRDLIVSKGEFDTIRDLQEKDAISSEAYNQSLANVLSILEKLKELGPQAAHGAPRETLERFFASDQNPNIRNLALEIQHNIDIAPKSSSAGFEPTGIAEIDRFNDGVARALKQLDLIAHKPVADRAEAAADLQALLNMVQDIAEKQIPELQSFRARAAESLTSEQVQESEKGQIAAGHLTRTMQGTTNAVRLMQHTGTLRIPAGATQSVISEPLDIYVETNSIIQEEFSKARSAKAFSPVHNAEISELQAVNQLVNCNIQERTSGEIPDLAKMHKNSFVIATTEGLRNRLVNQGYTNVIMLQDIREVGDIDFLNLAAFTKGRYLVSALGIVDDGTIKNILIRAYMNLTGETTIPQEYLNPGTFIIEMTLRPVSPVYADGELEDLHMMRLLALIAA